MRKQNFFELIPSSCIGGILPAEKASSILKDLCNGQEHLSEVLGQMKKFSNIIIERRFNFCLSSQKQKPFFKIVGIDGKSETELFQINAFDGQIQLI